MNLKNIFFQKIPKSTYQLAFFIYIGVCVFLVWKSQPVLIYEWQDILENLRATGEYKYLGHYSAYMPPLYPYYLLAFWKIIGGSNDSGLWLNLSIITQALVFFYAVFALNKTILKENSHTIAGLFSFLIIAFFPPILFGVIRNSPFALTTSIYIFCFLNAYKYLNTKEKRYLAYFLVFGIAGMYIRWDFPVYFGFLMIILALYKFSIKVSFILPALVIFLIYLPWNSRNYKTLGKFTYNTASAYNLAKGNSVNFQLLSINNFPYDPETKEVLTDEILAKEFESEIQEDEYLNRLTKDYIVNHPGQFIQNNIGKLAINFLQYFPDAFDNKKYKLGFFTPRKYMPITYSLFFVIFTVSLIIAILRYPISSLFHRNKQLLFYRFVCFSFIFHFFINSLLAPPMPRYILFYFPFFSIFIVNYYVFKQR